MTDRVLTDEQQTTQIWRAEYQRQLALRIERTLTYISNASTAQIRTHLRSFVTLLSESHRFPELTGQALKLISRLHPLPLRWGLGHLWEGELGFALEHIDPQRTDQAAEYLCSLSEVYRFRGQFNDAIAKAEAVLAIPTAPLAQAARAGAILFACYRASGRPQVADQIIEALGARFPQVQAAEIPPDTAQAWLKYQQCWLELLRERGEVDRALQLVEEMLRLDAREGAPEKTLTADLYTHRSTLLWVRSRYPEAVRDLQHAMRLFSEAEDPFNAESLKSNLGLVYWTMGELDLAETTLLESIQFYRETGSEQLLTYDIANLGLVYFARGNLDAALHLTQEHIALAEKINFIHEYHRGRRNLGTILYYFGEYKRSIIETSASHAYYETRGSRDAYGLDMLWLALCHHALGDHQQGLAMAEETLARARALQSRVLEQLALRCLAQFLPPEARQTPLLRSLELALQMDRKLEEAAVRLALAGTYQGEHRQQEWLAGSAILDAVGAHRWLAGRSPDNPPFLPLLL